MWGNFNYSTISHNNILRYSFKVSGEFWPVLLHQLMAHRSICVVPAKYERDSGGEREGGKEMWMKGKKMDGALPRLSFTAIKIEERGRLS